MSEIKQKKEPRKIISRRDRPAKPPLSLEGIIDTSLDLLAAGGLSGLSLRKVAAALDTGPSSLYVYVANIEALYGLILDRVLAEVSIPDASEGMWRDRLLVVLKSYTETLLSRPGLGRLAITTMASGPNMLRLMEVILGLLREGGIDSPRLAMSAMDTLLLHFSAIAAEQDSWRDHGSPIGNLEQAIKKISGEDFPNLNKLPAELVDGDDGASRMQWILNVLINGVLKTPY